MVPAGLMLERIVKLIVPGHLPGGVPFLNSTQTDTKPFLYPVKISLHLYGMKLISAWSTEAGTVGRNHSLQA
jgi:hypothetical protein